MRSKKAIVCVVIAGLTAAATVFAPAPPPAAPDTPPAVPTPHADQGEAGLSMALPQRETIGRLRGETFAARSWAPPPLKPATAPPVEVARPVVPPTPYRVAGQVMNGEGPQIVLAKGDRVLTVREGDTLEGGYRVESIAADRVTLLYVPLGVRESLPVSSTLDLSAQAAAASTPSAPAAVAQLRWEGPQQVRAGAAFEVALKVSSAQPVRATPLQLAFDAKLLEPMAVRAGSFFASGGNFSYRINPGGVIFVGASGPGGVAADAELVVFTFKPIRAASAAELKVSSLSLQGASGRAIAHELPSVFRTTIIQ